MDMSWLTPEVIAGLLGLLSVILTGIAGKLRSKKILAEDQGDRLLMLAKKAMEMVEISIAGKPEYQEKLKEAKGILAMVEDAWNDSKVRTPEFDELFEALMKVLKELN